MTTTSKNLVVTLLMSPGEAYLPGVLTLGFSLLLHRNNPTDYDTAIMVDQKIAQNPQIIGVLQQFYGGNIFPVPLIEAKVKALTTQRQQEVYGSWIERSFTKWNCLQFVNYEKVLFLDADTLVVRDIADIFSLPTPAADFRLYFSASRSWGGIFYPYPAGLKEGDPIPSDRVQLGLQYGNVGGGGVVLLTPSLETYLVLLEEIKTTSANVSGSGYGFGGISGPDEQALTMTYLRQGKPWYLLSSEYQVVPKDTYAYPEITRPKIFHFIGGKPWDPQMQAKGYPDVGIWLSYVEAIRLNPAYPDETKALFKTNAAAFNYCPWCRLIGRDVKLYSNHTFLKCPVIYTVATSKTEAQARVENLAPVPGLAQILHQTVPNISKPIPTRHYLYPEVLRTLPYNTYASVLNRAGELVALNNTVPKMSVIIRSPQAGAGIVASRNFLSTLRVITKKENMTPQLLQAIASPIDSKLSDVVQRNEFNVNILNTYNHDDILQLPNTDVVRSAFLKDFNIVIIIVKPELLNLATAYFAPLPDKEADFDLITERVNVDKAQAAVLYAINKVKPKTYDGRLVKLLPQPSLFVLPSTEGKVEKKPTASLSVEKQPTTAQVEKKEAEPSLDEPRGESIQVLESDVSKVNIFRYKPPTEAVEVDYEAKLIKYLTWLLGRSEYFLLTKPIVNTLVNDNTKAHWIRAFTASSYDPGNNYERDEAMGDRVTESYLVLHALSLDRSYSAAEVSRIIVNYNDKFFQAGIARRMGLQKYIRYIPYPDEKNKDPKYLDRIGDVYESFFGTLYTVARSQNVFMEVDKALRTFMSVIYPKNTFDPRLLVIDSDKTFVLQVYEHLGVRQGKRAVSAETKTVPGPDGNNLWSTVIQAPERTVTLPNSDPARQGAPSKMGTITLPSILASVNAEKTKRGSEKKAWKQARDYLEGVGISFQTATTIGNLRIEGKIDQELAQRGKEKVRSLGYEDYDFGQDPTNISSADVTNANIFLYGVRKNGSKQLLLYAFHEILNNAPLRANVMKTREGLLRALINTPNQNLPGASKLIK